MTSASKPVSPENPTTVPRALPGGAAGRMRGSNRIRFHARRRALRELILANSFFDNLEHLRVQDSFEPNDFSSSWFELEVVLN